MDKIYDVLRTYRYGCAGEGRYMTYLFVRSGIFFLSIVAKFLTHIGNEMLAKGVVDYAATGINCQRSRLSLPG